MNKLTLISTSAPAAPDQHGNPQVRFEIADATTGKPLDHGALTMPASVVEGAESSLRDAVLHLVKNKLYHELVRIQREMNDAAAKRAEAGLPVEPAISLVGNADAVARNVTQSVMYLFPIVDCPVEVES